MISTPHMLFIPFILDVLAQQGTLTLSLITKSPERTYRYTQNQLPLFPKNITNSRYLSGTPP